jgi:hypothetical protein
MAYVNKDARVVSAMLAGNRTEMDDAARTVQRAIVTIAAEHALTGAYIDGVVINKVPGEHGTGRRVTDRVVTSTDPATLSIEHGHLQGKRSQRDRRWVPGQHIMAQAIRRVR